jgi:arsenate reductase
MEAADSRFSALVFPGAKQRRHWSFPDPSRVDGSESQRRAAFRSVRDAIRRRIEHDPALSSKT